MRYVSTIMAVGLVGILAFGKGLEFDGRCPVCKEKGYSSNVEVGMSKSTLLASMPYYDKDGNYHNSDPNTVTTTYHCSSGHVFSVASGPEGNSVTIITNEVIGGNDIVDYSAMTNIVWTNIVYDYFCATNVLEVSYTPVCLYEDNRVTFFPESQNEVSLIGSNGVLRMEYTCKPDEAAQAVLDALKEIGKKEGFVFLTSGDARIVADALRRLQDWEKAAEEYRDLLRGM